MVEAELEVGVLAVLSEQADKVEVAIRVEFLEFQQITHYFLLLLLVSWGEVAYGMVLVCSSSRWCLYWMVVEILLLLMMMMIFEIEVVLGSVLR